MKRATVIILTVVLLAASVLAAGDKRMTIEDSLAIKDVMAPQWSPDGRWIAFTISEWNRKENRRDSHIYLLAAEGGEPIKLTNGPRGESAPQWSPDGTRIAFLANRDAAPQGQQGQPGAGGNDIYIISARGGEAERLTEEESPVTQLRWSPDGKQIAYIVRDTPKDKAEREKRKKDRFDAIVVDQDLIYSHLWTINVATKEKKRLTEGAFSAADPQWSPDGKQIAYVTSPAGSQESVFTDISEDRNSDIYVVPAGGGQARKLTQNPGPDAGPRWSPDGRQIAYLASDDPNAWAQKTDIYIIPAAGGTPRNLTAKEKDATGFNLQWSPDGKAVYTAVGVGVYTQIVRVSVSDGALQSVFEKPLALTGFGGNFDLSADGQWIAYTASDAKEPAEIYVATAAGRNARRLTRVNPQIADFSLADTEIIKWKGPDGFDIEGILVKPLGYQAGRRYPTILQIHGGPYGRFSYGFNSRAQIFAAHGYAVLMPNPRGSTGYGIEFARANIADWGGKDFQDLMAGVDEVIRLGIADPDRLAVMGGSYGGFMTFWTITQTDRFKAAIGHAAISDWYSFHGQSDIPGLMEYGFGGTPWKARDTYVKYSPMTYVERVKTPLLITHGERDFRVNIQQGEQYYRSLRKRGVEVVFVRYPREGHGINEPNHVIDLVGRQLAWFEKHVKGVKADPASASTK